MRCYIHIQSDTVNASSVPFCCFRSGRICTEDCVVGNLHMKKGVQVLIEIFTIHRNPELWSEPDKFDPERYAVQMHLTVHRHCMNTAVADLLLMAVKKNWHVNGCFLNMCLILHTVR